MKKRLLLALAVFSLATLSGCAFLQNLFNGAFKKPSLNFKTLNLKDLSLSAATLDLVYTLDNPNPLGLSLASIDYALSVEGHSVVSGRPPNGLHIPEHGKTDLTFPATVKFQDIVPAVEVFLNKDYAHYRAEGHIGIQTPLGVLQLPISKEGQFEVPKVPNIQFQAPRVTGLTFAGATLELPITVTNRNSFALPIQGVGGTLQVAGHDVGSLNLGNLGSLAGRQSRQMTLPVNLQFAGAASALAALRGGSTTLGFRGSVTSGNRAIPLNLSQQVAIRH